MPTSPTTTGATSSATTKLPVTRAAVYAHVGAEHEDDAVREIHDAHDAEDQRQAAGDEKQDRRLRQRAQALRQTKPKACEAQSQALSSL